MKQTILGLVAALILGLAIGRFSLPAKIVTKIQTVEVDKKHTDSQDNTVITTTKTTHPDGTVTEITRTENNIKTNISETDEKQSKSEKDVTYNTNRWVVSAIAVTDLKSNLGLTYGGSVSYKILGPINVGALALTNGIVGVSLGLSF